MTKTIYECGRDARASGLNGALCHYDSKEQWLEWCRGWDDEDRERRQNETQSREEQ